MQKSALDFNPCHWIIYRLLLLCVLFSAASVHLHAQTPKTLNGAELRLQLQRLNVLGSVLHIAAHPDDENTAMLAYFANDRLLRTGYLSLTRGDGGQNLIGAERGASLGILRTQELLAARRIDGAEQFFTRAVDFGFSKSPEETLRIWNRNEVLADVVWIIRRFRPDVIITRFPTTGEGGHGHHTASAILAVEAFRLAGDPTQFTEQLRYVQPWQPRRLVWNAFRPNTGGGATNRATSPSANDKISLSLDLGAYNALLGKSYTEIAAASRSMHKSQGFGSAARRGTNINSFTLIAGEPATKDLFDGVDTTWARIPGGAQVGRMLAEALQRYDEMRPQMILPLLIAAHRELEKLPQNDSLLAIKRAELTEAIKASAGLWTEAIASDRTAVPGSEVEVSATVVKRAPYAVELTRIETSLPNHTEAVNTPLNNTPLETNIPFTQKLRVRLPANLEVSQPYWLRDTPPDSALARVDDQLLRGLADNQPPLDVNLRFTIDGEPVDINVPVLYRTVDPVRGERYLPFALAPSVAINLDENVYIFPDQQTKQVRLTLRGNAASLSGDVRLRLPEGWRAAPDAIPVSFAMKGAERTVTFSLTPPTLPTTGELAVEFVNAAATATAAALTLSPARSVQLIAYEHIPEQLLFPLAHARLVRLDLRRRASQIGYVMGAGDEIPGALRQLGYTVQVLTDEDLDGLDLKNFSAIITGIRAYNTRPRLIKNQTRLLDYVQAGGTLIVQYNTADDDLPRNLGPFPFRVSRERVTVEEASVRFDADKLLTSPNPITAADFDGWVQERGLYFADEWDRRYRTPLSTNDPGEAAKRGGMLIADYGRGKYIYTSYAWFRQLPAGVPGAYRLFVNMIEAGKE